MIFFCYVFKKGRENANLSISEKRSLFCRNLNMFSTYFPMMSSIQPDDALLYKRGSVVDTQAKMYWKVRWLR